MGTKSALLVIGLLSLSALYGLIWIRSSIATTRDRIDQFIVAIQNEELNTVTKLLLDWYAHFLFLPLADNYPLVLAVRLNKPKVVSHLIYLGEPINTNFQPSLVLEAVTNCAESLLQQLLVAGANPHYRNNRSQNAIHVAVRNCSVSMVRQLVLSGVNVNAYDEDWYTPLHLAVLANRSDMVEYLLSLNLGDDSLDSDTLPCNETGSSVPIIQTESVNHYRFTVDVTAGDQDRNTPLHLAIAINNEVIVRQLTAVPVTLTKRAYPQHLPLDWAILYHRTTMVRLLLAAGSFRSQYTVQYALQTDSEEILQLVLDAETSTKSRQSLLQEALISTIKNGRLSTVQRLLAMGADPKLRDHRVGYPIEEAIRYGQGQIVQYMLTHRFNDPTDWDERSKSPLQLAVSSECIECLIWLLAYGVNMKLDLAITEAKTDPFKNHIYTLLSLYRR